MSSSNFTVLIAGQGMGAGKSTVACKLEKRHSHVAELKTKQCRDIYSLRRVTFVQLVVLIASLFSTKSILSKRYVLHRFKMTFFDKRLVLNRARKPVLILDELSSLQVVLRLLDQFSCRIPDVILRWIVASKWFIYNLPDRIVYLECSREVRLLRRLARGRRSDRFNLSSPERRRREIRVEGCKRRLMDFVVSHYQIPIVKVDTSDLNSVNYDLVFAELCLEK